MDKNTETPKRRKIKSPFARNLKWILEERKVSARAAAKMAGVSPSVLSDWLMGGAPNNHLAVQKLSKGLKVNFEWLLTGEGSYLPANSKTGFDDLFEEDSKGLNGIFKIQSIRLKKLEGG